MIKIDFTDTYELIEVAEDLSFTTFYSPAKNEVNVLVMIKISNLHDPLLPNVHNLAYGPLSETGEIDDKARIEHLNLNKTFSTILLFGLTFLQRNPTTSLGVDGSNDVRAYLYHRMFHTNRQAFDDIFVTIGVDWFVRLLRNGSVETDAEGYPFFKPKPDPFDYDRSFGDLYRYYVFYLKRKIASN